MDRASDRLSDRLSGRLPHPRPRRFAAVFLLLFALVVGLLMPGSAGRAQGGGSVDLELVLAVDASSSVSAEEFDLQMRGLAVAFRSPAVLRAIQAAGDLGIAVGLVQWSDDAKQSLAIGWRRLGDAATAAAYADEIEATPRFLVGGGTAIGGALTFAINQLQSNGFEGRRQVIDLSGDGRTNQGKRPHQVRDQAVALGITINGLAILNEDAFIDRYYRNNVIGGEGAFVMTAADYEDYAEAMLEKLVQEIAGVPVAELPERGPVKGAQSAAR